MLAGPIFSREALTSPRRLRHFLVRAGYVAALFLLMWTAKQVTVGFQDVYGAGELARFGSLVFQIFSLIQLSLALFFALVFSAANVAQEKDRRTLTLLLMTDLRDRELVLGKLGASLLLVGVLLAASLPVFVFLQFLGGVTLGQIFRVFALCAAAAIAAGSWGSLVAFWREKTFQTLAISVLGLVLFLGAVEGVVLLSGDTSAVGWWVGLLDPYRSLLMVLDPFGGAEADVLGLDPAWWSVLLMVALAVVLNGLAILRLRVWNPSRAVYESVRLQARQDAEDDAAVVARKRTRAVWSNPVLWREIRTRAYGRKTVLIKLAYLVLAAAAVYRLWQAGGDGELLLGAIAPAGVAFVGLGVLSLMLINAQAVTALTTERDEKTLEPLLMTDMTAKEFIYGKLGGIAFNTKELVLVPLALLAYYLAVGQLGLENSVYAVVTFLALAAFATMLGVHYGLSYENSRSAIGVSLGTLFFLTFGIVVFMMLLVEARGSFLLQFQSFFIFIVVGSIGLWWALKHKNPSTALFLSALCLPFLTFYAITQFLIGGTLGVCLAISAAYGFTTIAMLVPAVSEFDVALGRTTLDQG
ncbi:MAG: ABC transporter permease [Planctomycetaceae bacterium]